MWIPKDAALIRGRCLFKVRRLLEEIRYGLPNYIDDFFVGLNFWKWLCFEPYHLPFQNDQYGFDHLITDLLFLQCFKFLWIYFNDFKRLTQILKSKVTEYRKCKDFINALFENDFKQAFIWFICSQIFLKNFAIFTKERLCWGILSSL